MAEKEMDSPTGWGTPVGTQPINIITPETPDLFLHKKRSFGEDSKQDSGYSSLTPGSIDSFRDKCRHCNSIKKENYDHSTPDSSLMCLCKNPAPCHMQMISEYFSRPCSSRFGQQLNLYDEGTDSLYSDPMNVEEEGPVEDLNCVLEFDEKSMDFAEDHFEKTPEPQETHRKKDMLVNSLDTINTTATKNVKISSKGVTSINNKPNGVKQEITSMKKNKNDRFLSAAKKVVTLVKVVKRFPLCGIEKLDFFYQLCVKISCPHVASTILSFLSDKDLHNARQVSSTWTEVVDNDFHSYKRWKAYYNNKKMWKENYTSPVKRQHSIEGKEFEGSPRSLRRLDMNACTPYQSNMRFVPSPPVSPNSARFRSFQKAGKQLKPGEKLLRCPKCFFASQDSGNPVVQCTRSGCRHRFCFWCRGEIFQGNEHTCRPLYSPQHCSSPGKSYTAGSKKSKRLLRRLSNF